MISQSGVLEAVSETPRENPTPSDHLCRQADHGVERVAEGHADSAPIAYKSQMTLIAMPTHSHTLPAFCFPGSLSFM